MELPYYSSCLEWVESLPYGVPLHMYKGKDCKGFIYDNPFESVWGEYPGVVYERLFKEEHYYGISDEDLAELRTTIQYFRVYTNSLFKKTWVFLESVGFVNYRQIKEGGLIHAYFRRGDISLYISNLTTPQDYRPNTFEVEFAIIVGGEGKKGRRKHLNTKYIDLPDDFGELTIKEFERELDNIEQYGLRESV